MPFTQVTVAEAVAECIGGRDLVLAGIRPEHFEDAALVDPEERGRGTTLTACVDVIEWLGMEQFAYIPYEAPPEVAEQLRSLARELDSEAMRTQLVVILSPDSKIRRGDEAELWFDPARMHFFDPVSGENLTRDLARAAVA
jgi:multiple sugar transport system ATP-binding protein